MTDRYKLCYAPKTVAEIAATLQGMQYTGMTYFASFRTQSRECGRPITGLRKPRWFEESRDPDQLWLPFEDFTPVRMHEPSHSGPNRWHCDFTIDEGEIYRAWIDTSNYQPGSDTLQALEVYERVEEPQSPFGPSIPRGRPLCESHRQALTSVRNDPELAVFLESVESLRTQTAVLRTQTAVLRTRL